MFIDDLITNDYYEQIPISEKHKLAFGNIYRTPTYYPHENLELWRPLPDPSEPTKTIATKFQLVSSAQDKFSRSIPLGAPPLKTDEEFIVVRAKIRPVVLLVPQISIDGITPLRAGGKIWRKRCLVGQVFSLSNTQSGEVKFPESFIDGVRSLKYPQLMYLPKRAGLFFVDSLLRLDECQSVFTPHLEPTGYRLSQDLRELLRSQFFYLFDEFDDGCFMSYSELLTEDTS